LPSTSTSSNWAQADGENWRRVVMEKPFGHDLESARQLNDIVESVCPQDAVFRIDHYLGKETVHNVLAPRFANQLFEPLWNANYVDHVQITVAEDIGTGGRAGYYDGVGAASDVIQNHLLQLTATEELTSFNAFDLRAGKETVLVATQLPEDARSPRRTRTGDLSPIRRGAVRRRLERRQGGPRVPGGGSIPAESTTETYAAIRCSSTPGALSGVPFYLRAGKRLGRPATEIAVVFKRAENLLFRDHNDDVGRSTTMVFSRCVRRGPAARQRKRGSSYRARGARAVRPGCAPAATSSCPARGCPWQS
jgi:glucose-6-phosphate 1-dehydrogenase